MTHDARWLGGDLAPGYFIAPTVFGDVDHGSALAREEIFGPVLSVLRFSDEDEVVARVNDSAYGLSAYLHTRDVARAHRLAARFEVGSVVVNAFPPGSPTAPSEGSSTAGSGGREDEPASTSSSAPRTSSSGTERPRSERNRCRHHLRSEHPTYWRTL